MDHFSIGFLFLSERVNNSYFWLDVLEPLKLELLLVLLDEIKGALSFNELVVHQCGIGVTDLKFIIDWAELPLVVFQLLVSVLQVVFGSFTVEVQNDSFYRSLGSVCSSVRELYVWQLVVLDLQRL